MEVGDRPVISDNGGFEYDAQPRFVHPKSSRWKREIPGAKHVILIVAIPWGEKMDAVVRQATELGVTRMIWSLASAPLFVSMKKPKKCRDGGGLPKRLLPNRSAHAFSM
jgi:16S rRNA U1498 N3-methylase RsmE